MHTFKRARQYIGHRAIINSIDVNGQFICSASDDSTVKVWDNRSKEAAKSFKTGCPNTSVAFSRDGEYIFAGGIDNLIKAINIKRNQVDFVL
jgi:Prp8 binding protein